MDRFRAALTGSQSVGAPGDNPLGASMAGLFKNFNDSSFQNAVGTNALSALAVDQAVKTQNAEQAAEAERKRKLAELQDQMKKTEDALAGKNYQIVKKEDGGFDYYAPTGQRVSLDTYSKVTGKDPQDILKDSENSLDQQYVADYNNLSKLLGFIRNGDKNGAQDFLKKNPGAVSQHILDNWNTPGFADQLVTQFRDAYPNVYANTGPYGGQTGTNRQGAYGLFDQPPEQGGGGGTGNGFLDFARALGGGAINFDKNVLNTFLPGFRRLGL